MQISRRGCSVVELLVAIVVFTVGALSLAGSTAIVLRGLSTSDVRVTSARAAASRFARLTATRCSSLASGSSQIAPGLLESWSVTPTGAGHARARVTVEFEPESRSELFEATISCR